MSFREARTLIHLAKSDVRTLEDIKTERIKFRRCYSIAAFSGVHYWQLEEKEMRRMRCYVYSPVRWRFLESETKVLWGLFSIMENTLI